MRKIHSNLLVAVLMSLSLLGACKKDGEAAEPVAAPVVAKPKACRDCGTVSAINEVRRKGEASGAGAFMGAVIGGVIGHQVGGGRGKDVATVAGAAGGAMAGHEIEKRRNATTHYDVTVRMEDGSTRVVSVASQAGIAIGSKVRVVGNDLELRS